MVNNFHELKELITVDQGSETKSSLFPWHTGRRSHPAAKNEELGKTLETLDTFVSKKPSPHTKKQASSNVKGPAQKCIGRGEEADKIIQQLLSNNTEILPIIGIGGLGKTALAKLVYEKVDIKDGVKVFIEGVDSFHRESIEKSIIEKVKQPEDKKHNHPSEAAGERRYLFVLDDVKSVDAEEWSKFREILPSPSSVLITTRSIEVAKMTGTVPPVALQGLSEDHAWSLFKAIVASPFKQSDSRNEDNGRKMVAKCKGVPLAIEIMGSLWQTSNITIESMEKNFLEELELIYCNGLPFPLNLCFAFCSLFRDHDVIDVRRLTSLWIGERFILPTSECEVVVAEQYFKDLSERSMLQDVVTDELDHPTSCKIHPLMHYLATYMAGYGYMSVDPDGEGDKKKVRHASFDFSLDVSPVIPESLSAELLTILLRAEKQSRLPNEMKMSPSTCEGIFAKFKSLRVLDLHDLGMRTVPNSLGYLSLLKYLDLSRNKMERLPSSINKLKLLQTLRLSHCRELKELPKDLDNLTKLRHLQIDGCLDLTLMPECIKKMTALQTLSLFVGGSRPGLTRKPSLNTSRTSTSKFISGVLRKPSTSSSSTNFISSPTSTSSASSGLSQAVTGGLRGLADLNELRGVLEIAHLERCNAADAVEAKLQEKHDLQRLILRWDPDDNNINNDEAFEDVEWFLEGLKPPNNLKALFIMGYGGKTLSSWLSSLQFLVKFSLYNCRSCESIPPLHQLQSLKILELQRLNLKFIVDNSGVGPTESDTKEVFFPSLKKLLISDCPELKSWWNEDPPIDNRQSFPKISTLDIQYCPQLTCLPLCVNLDDRLVVVCSNLTPVLDTRNITSSPPPFSKLKSMPISNMDLGAQSHENWLGNFNSLQNLLIRECHDLMSLPEGFQNLKSLQDLTIEDCLELRTMQDSLTEWNGLEKLRTLTMRGLPHLQCLPKQLATVTTLQELRLYDCNNVASWPKNIGNLNSLKKLVISKCYKLDSLPRGLTSLDTLTIKDCPKLVPKCQPETGDYWKEIKNIKNLSVQW